MQLKLKFLGIVCVCGEPDYCWISIIKYKQNICNTVPITKKLLEKYLLFFCSLIIIAL